MQKSLKYFSVPNIFTSLNLVAGFLAIGLAFDNPNHLTYASIAIFIGMLFDFADGFFARLLNQKSEIGKELDSLADLVTFGVAPAVIVFQLLKVALKVKAFSLTLPWVSILVLLIPSILVISSALRLAKFNLDTRQTDVFLGIPTPVSAFFFASLPLLKDFDPDKLIIISNWWDINLPIYSFMAIIGLQIFVMENIYFYITLLGIFSVMLLVEMPMFSLKFKNFKFRENKTRYIFLALSLILLLFMQTFALTFIVFVYIIISIIKNIISKKSK